MKRILAVVLTLALMLGVMPTAFAAEETEGWFGLFTAPTPSEENSLPYEATADVENPVPIEIEGKYEMYFIFNEAETYAGLFGFLAEMPENEGLIFDLTFHQVEVFINDRAIENPDWVTVEEVSTTGTDWVYKLTIDADAAAAAGYSEFVLRAATRYEQVEGSELPEYVRPVSNTLGVLFKVKGVEEEYPFTLDLFTKPILFDAYLLPAEALTIEENPTSIEIEGKQELYLIIDEPATRASLIEFLSSSEEYEGLKFDLAFQHIEIFINDRNPVDPEWVTVEGISAESSDPWMYKLTIDTDAAAAAGYSEFVLCAAARYEQTEGSELPEEVRPVSQTGRYNIKVSGAEQPVTDNSINPEAAGMSYANTESVKVGETSVTFEMYQLRDAQGGETNYVKLRDVAFVLNGTEAQFNVDWSEDKGIFITTKTAYTTANGQEMQTPFTGDQEYEKISDAIEIDGEQVELQAFTLQSGGYTYFKLRDLGRALGFNVGWSEAQGVFIDATQPYTDAD